MNALWRVWWFAWDRPLGVSRVPMERNRISVLAIQTSTYGSKWLQIVEDDSAYSNNGGRDQRADNIYFFKHEQHTRG